MTSVIMRQGRRFFLALAACLFATSVLAQEFDPKGKYELVKPPLPTETKGKVAAANGLRDLFVGQENNHVLLFNTGRQTGTDSRELQGHGWRPSILVFIMTQQDASTHTSCGQKANLHGIEQHETKGVLKGLGRQVEFELVQGHERPFQEIFHGHDEC